MNPATEMTAATALKPTAITSSREEVSTLPSFRACLPSRRCNPGVPNHFDHVTAATTSKAAAKYARLCAVSCIFCLLRHRSLALRVNGRGQGAGEVNRHRLGRIGLDAVTAGEVVMHQSSFGAGGAPSQLEGDSLPIEPISLFHHPTPARESTEMSLCHRAPRCELR